MSIIRFFTSSSFWVQLGMALLIGVGMIIGLVQYLKVYTKHGQEIEVPDLTDLHIDQIGQLLSQHKLRFQVVDSTYLRGKQAMLVYEQDPKAGSMVKENRTIYLSITSSNTPKVKLPDLVDLSLRKATIDLKNLGLTVGELIMRPDIANNVVLEMSMSGKQVYPGKEVPKGSTVDLVVGIYNVDSLVSIPNLIGLNIEEARFYLSENALYLGRITYGTAISDTSKALVVRQFPEVEEEELINTMSYVDIWVE
ncbi:MAG: PASTA domain-containing protein [Bacteroidia bacterium]